MQRDRCVRVLIVRVTERPVSGPKDPERKRFVAATWRHCRPQSIATLVFFLALQPEQLPSPAESRTTVACPGLVFQEIPCSHNVRGQSAHLQRAYESKRGRRQSWQRVGRTTVMIPARTSLYMTWFPSASPTESAARGIDRPDQQVVRCQRTGLFRSRRSHVSSGSAS